MKILNCYSIYCTHCIKSPQKYEVLQIAKCQMKTSIYGSQFIAILHEILAKDFSCG